MTYRATYVHRNYVEEAKRMHPKGSFVYGLWHECFFAAVACHRNQNIAPMISQSNDGELISYIGTKFGFVPVRGSTTRGGEQAREALYRQIDHGLVAAFTADGPKGPRRKMKSGLIELSRSGRMAIVPIGVHADRAWRLSRSWDRSLIPKPFSKVTVTYGKPYIVPADAHGAAFAEEKRRATTMLNEVTPL